MVQADWMPGNSSLKVYNLVGFLHLQDFFKALKRVKQIHSDCKVLLRTNQQTAG